MNGFFWSTTPKISDIFGLPFQNYLFLQKSNVMYIEREIHSTLIKHIGKKEYTIITGARQTGKTTLITRIYSKMKSAGENVFYLSFENPEVLNDINEDPENVFKYSVRPADPLKAEGKNKRVILFIDEVQYADNPSGFLKYLYDKYLENLKIVATGSSAFYLDSSFKDSLAGRKRIFILRTLNFEEFLHFSGRDDLSDVLKTMRAQPDYISLQKNEMLEKLAEYMVYGGYPAVVLEKDYDEKTERLKEIKNAFLKRDVDEAGIINSNAFRKMAMLLSAQTGSLVNKNELSNTLGIDNKTVERYLLVMQKCFHIELIRPYTNNLRKELTKMPMVYFYDNGMRNALLKRFYPIDVREDKGQLLENYVFIRLAEKFDVEDIHFWRTTDRNEIDFIIDTGMEKQAVEVKFDCRHRKNKSFERFSKDYPDFSFQTLSYDFGENCLQVLKL
jgi:predicted AAA+ superfamily ATPase